MTQDQAQGGAIGEWPRANCSRLTTLDPDATDDDDLKPLDDIIGDA